MRILTTTLIVAMSVFASAAFAQDSGPPAPAQVADPLAPARTGQLQCSRPNVAQHACRSISAYRFQPDGAIDAQTVTALNADPLILMMTITQGTVRDGAVCGEVRTSDIDAASFSVNGQPAPEQMGQRIRDRLKERISSMALGEVCATYAPDGDGFTASVTAHGEPRPDLGHHFIWVRPDEGYTVNVTP